MHYNFAEKHIWEDGRYEFLQELIRRFDLKLGVEVGVACGHHARVILEKTDVQKLWGVDPYQNRPDYDDVMNRPQEEFEAMYAYVLEQMDPFGSRFMLIREPSVTAAMRHFSVGEIDFAYIDGEHTLAEALIDCAVWFEALRPGGILAGDDFSIPAVASAASYFARKQKRELRVANGLSWWLQK